MIGRLLLGFIRLYQRVASPYLGGRCRFIPSCSHYTYEAVERYGPLKGLALGLRRLLRCHPWGPRGYDPLP